MRRTRLGSCSLALATTLLLAACSADGLGPPRVQPPQVGVGDDLRFAVDGVHRWYLVGNALTPDQGTIEVVVTAPTDEPVEVVDVWVAGRPGQRLAREPGSNRFTATLAIDGLPAGEHELLFAYDGKELAFARRVFTRTHPLYFVMSTDWDFSDPGDGSLTYHERLRQQHPAMKFTHFIGPYTYTDPELPAARKDQLTTWLQTQRDQHGDEIGLHIHPYCHFVTTAGLTCITDQSTVYASDPGGYTIKVEAYGQAGFETLLTRADEIFVARGLGKPVTFRAGGWTASIETLKALAAKGYVADTSANNWARMEEWEGVESGELYRWNMANWQSIGDTSQPYYPNVTDKLSGAAPHVPILEVPDNAIMVDYVTVAEMKEIFGKNWAGGALPEPRTFMMGFHPSMTMDAGEYVRLDGILDHADQFLAANHAGPVVYAVLKDLPRVWPVP